MLARPFLPGILMLGLALRPVTSQTRPDLSGSWQATRETPASVAVAPSAVFGEQFALKHTDQGVDFFRPVRDRPLPFATSHRTDGSESRITLPSRTCLGQTGQVVKAAWEGSAMTYTVVGAIAAGSSTPTPANVRYAFRLEGPDVLVVESALRTSATAAPTPVGTVYRRMPQPLPTTAMSAPAKGAPANIAQVSWIVGNWLGVNGTATVEERWTTAAGGAMLALSRTVRNSAMTEFEFLCIAERDESLVYTAMPNAAAPTHFVLSAIDATSVTFENASNDFPKKIQYVLKPDGTLEATISGAAPRRPITFAFKRQP